MPKKKIQHSASHRQCLQRTAKRLRTSPQIFSSNQKNSRSAARDRWAAAALKLKELKERKGVMAEEGVDAEEGNTKQADDEEALSQKTPTGEGHH
ncbi:hypothetical protein DL769_007372 [Monosporascus sp. CRB-8-3]|nr:hypothetical protein DL769_007372 [Monosporascus sp. CRB-8-3]